MTGLCCVEMNNMQYNIFNSKSLGQISISRLGMGCMRLPVITPGGEDIDYKRAEEVIDYAYSHGVNYFDTAIGYHDKGSEPFVGYALSKYPRESFYLATKLSSWFLKENRGVEDIFKWQQERLKTDYFDFYLCHNLNDNVYNRLESVNAYERLTELKKQGKIKNLGFSFHGSIELLDKLLNEYEWDFAQIQFNYLDAQFGNAMKEYEMIHAAGIPISVMEPVRGGSLANLCDDANRLLTEASPDSSIASWAMRYAATPKGVYTVLSGMSSIEQVADNVKTMSDFKAVTDSENNLLSKAAELFKEFYSIPCTNCKYCMDVCPNGINIPELMKLYRSWKLDKNILDYLRSYSSLTGGEKAEECISCGVCEEKCPQSIAIPNLLNEIKELNASLEVK